MTSWLKNTGVLKSNTPVFCSYKLSCAENTDCASNAAPHTGVSCAAWNIGLCHR